jgi:hypothetical protein
MPPSIVIAARPRADGQNDCSAPAGMTIAGSSSEIQHNIIGERVLGLPKG